MITLRSILGISTASLRSLLPRPLYANPVAARQISLFPRITSNNRPRVLRETIEGPSNGVVGSSVRTFEQTRGMKTRSSVKRLCNGCKV
ncbi:hypothetical protein PHISCL_04284 [Aspergillus sclerotialis]|uniref:Uncharacterized protein n=1 Tax=Aspergillus sclerotialis TaxID=2070753 RepID=A0A3A2ZJM8_9EURO|nr:hypothetical protein PHISCL_04284 [Aspergillus sclerotialis]